MSVTTPTMTTTPTRIDDDWLKQMLHRPLDMDLRLRETATDVCALSVFASEPTGLRLAQKAAETGLLLQTSAERTPAPETNGDFLRSERLDG